MSDSYSALDVLDDLHAVGVWPIPLWAMGVAVCHDCGHQLGTFERQRTLCALCERTRTSAMLRRYLTADERSVTLHHWTPGVGAFPSQRASQPDGFGSVPVLSPRKVTTHHARARVADAGGAP